MNVNNVGRVGASNVAVCGPLDYERLISAIGCNGYSDDKQAYDTETRANGKPNEEMIL